MNSLQEFDYIAYILSTNPFGNNTVYLKGL